MESNVLPNPWMHPDARNYLDIMAQLARPPYSDAVIAMMRQIPEEQVVAMMEVVERPLGTIAVDRRLAMPGPDGPVNLRLFDSREERGPGPVVVFYHGGGFVVGSVATHASLAAEIARLLDLPVISVEYRLAPEHKFPAAPDDAEAAARWIAGNGDALGRTFTGLVLCGDSAGGNLVTVTAAALRDRPAALPLRMQIALYPKTDGSRTYPSRGAFDLGYGLDGDALDYFGDAYRPDKASPRYSALLGDLAGLPPTLVLTCGLDPLRDEGRAYAAKAIAAGVETHYREIPGMIHGAFTYRKAIPAAQAVLEELMDEARAMIARISG